VLGWSGAAVGAAVAVGFSAWGIVTLANSNTDALPKQPARPDDPVPALVAEPQAPKAKPRRLVLDADERGHAKDVRLFAGTPCEVRVDDKNVVLFTSGGKARAALASLDGDALAKILGYQAKGEIPEEHLQGGAPAVLFLGGDGRWVLAINGAGYVVGYEDAEKRGAQGIVYSDRADLKQTLGACGFREAQNTAGYVKDADLQAVMAGMPEMLETADPADKGVFGEPRRQSLSNVRGMAAALQAEGKK
jgi:hypothetical protein